MRNVLTILFPLLFILRSADAQNVTILIPNSHTLVQWQENPLTITVEGYSCKDVIVKASNGAIKADGCSFIYTASDTSIHRTSLDISVKAGNTIKLLKSEDFPVVALPDPEPILAGQKAGDTISRQVLLATPGISLVSMSINQNIINYSLKIMRNDSILLFNRTNLVGARFPADMTAVLNDWDKENLSLIAYNIHILLYKKEKRVLTKPVVWYVR